MMLVTVTKFLEHLKVIKGCSEHTIRNYGIDLQALASFINSSAADIPLSSIDRQTVRRFIHWMSESGMSKRSIARRLSSLRSFFAYCLQEQKLTHNPMEDIGSPKLDATIPPSLTYEQVVALFKQPTCSSYLGLRDRAILELFYSSGLRVSELVGLNKDDYDQTNLLLRVRGKGNKERIVPITKNGADWIATYLNSPLRHISDTEHTKETDSHALFLNKHGTRLTTRSVDRMFVKYLKMSGLHADITPHTIRHTIATHWLENGMDLKTIQLLLGHSTMATTTIYTRVSTKLKQEIVQKLHPRYTLGVGQE